MTELAGRQQKKIGPFGLTLDRLLQATCAESVISTTIRRNATTMVTTHRSTGQTAAPVPSTAIA
jgi:hypothetical protein